MSLSLSIYLYLYLYLYMTIRLWLDFSRHSEELRVAAVAVFFEFSPDVPSSSLSEFDCGDEKSDLTQTTWGFWMVHTVAAHRVLVWNHWSAWCTNSSILKLLLRQTESRNEKQFALTQTLSQSVLVSFVRLVFTVVTPPSFPSLFSLSFLSVTIRQALSDSLSLSHTRAHPACSHTPSRRNSHYLISRGSSHLAL